MKYYFIVNTERKRINRAVAIEGEESPSFIPENSELLEVTEAQYNSYMETKQGFFVNDELLSVQDGIKYNMEKRKRDELLNKFATDPEGVKEVFITKARDDRQKLEQGGFQFMGMTIPSDRDSQLMINGAVSAAKDDPTFSTIWQVTPTTFVPLDAAIIIALGHTMRDHINSAFIAQANKVNTILAATTFEELESI